jgi:hypothetical protein
MIKDTFLITKEFFKKLHSKDDDIDEMVQAYRTKYLDMGLRILCTSFFISYFIIVIILYLFTDPLEPYRKRMLNLGGMHVIIFSILKLIQVKHPDKLNHAIAV